MLKHSHRHRPHPRSPIHPCPPPASPKNKGLPTGFKTDKESKFWNGFMVFKAKIVCDLQSTDHAKQENMDSFMVRKIDQICDFEVKTMKKSALFFTSMDRDKV